MATKAAKEAVPKLVHALRNDEDALARWRAAEALGQLGKAAREAVQNQGVAGPAASAMRQLGEAAREAAPDLRHAVRNDGDAGVRLRAANALAELGEAAKKAVPESGSDPKGTHGGQ